MASTVWYFPTVHRCGLPEMAQFGKKIYIIPSSGGEQMCNIYSTTGESGTLNQPMIVDGQIGYVPLVATTDTRATAGRVRLSTGQEWALGMRGVIAYAYQLITGSGSFTVPADVGRLRVTCVGGGAGGFVSTWRYTNPTYDYTDASGNVVTVGAGPGGTTTFGTISATGAGVATATYSGSSLIATTQSCGQSCGGEFRDNDVHRGPSTSIYNIHGTLITQTGTGGYSDLDSSPTGFPGGSGNLVTGYMNVTPGQVIAVTIGGGGVGRCRDFTTWDYNSGGEGCNGGSAGAVLVEWGQGIE